MWASKYNERALLSMRKVGLDFRDLRMAVLVQRVVPAAYAFVIHTHNPATGAADEVGNFTPIHGSQGACSHTSCFPCQCSRYATERKLCLRVEE